MKSVLITGCNRGIGLGLVKHLVKGPKSPKHIFTTCRIPQQAKVSDATYLAAKMCFLTFTCTLKLIFS